MSVVCGTIITLLLAIVGPWWERRYGSKGPLTYVLWVVDRPGNDEPLRVMVDRRWFSEHWMQECDWTLYHNVMVEMKQVMAIPHRPYWFIEDIYTPHESTDLLYVITHASGWPLRALIYVDWSGFTQPPHTSSKIQYTTGQLHGYETNWRIPWLGAITEVIPLRPIWPGLLLNIAFWSTIIVAPTMWFRTRRRNARRRRALCVECLYDLRASESGRCPECGTLQVRSRGELEPQAARNASLN